MSPIKLTLESYALNVLTPHLHGMVRDIRSRESTAKKSVSLRVFLDPEDHAQATHADPEEIDLETLTAMMVASLAEHRFGYACRVSFRPVDAG